MRDGCLMERMRFVVSSPFQMPVRPDKIIDAGTVCLQSPWVLYFKSFFNGNRCSISPHFCCLPPTPRTPQETLPAVDLSTRADSKLTERSWGTHEGEAVGMRLTNYGQRWPGPTIIFNDHLLSKTIWTCVSPASLSLPSFLPFPFCSNHEPVGIVELAAVVAHVPDCFLGQTSRRRAWGGEREKYRV